MRLIIILLFGFMSDSLIDDQTDLDIFNPNRTYSYEATFINDSGDTLSAEKILLKPMGEPWKMDKNQAAIEVQYNYSLKDSLFFKSVLDPQSKKRKNIKTHLWSKKITTGAVSNDKEVWIHPFRSNQYNYTEIAPFPKVVLDSLMIGGQWSSKLHILMGWGAFKGKLECKYKVVKKEIKQYGHLTISCWYIQSIGKHNKLGNSYHDFYFHPDHGFVEMRYRFYNGTAINFVLEDLKVEL